MNKGTILYEIKVQIAHSEDELPAIEKLAIKKAKEATHKSYAPYSHFHVGAAVVLEDNTIIVGNNQENCAYPSGICAERTAVFYANSQHPNKAIKILAIAARTNNGNFLQRSISPCGACRQVLLETENRQHSPMKIIMYGTSEIKIVESASHLLPIQFDDTCLNR